MTVVGKMFTRDKSLGNSLISRADAIVNSIAKSKNFQFFRIFIETKNGNNANYIGSTIISFTPSCILIDVYATNTGQVTGNFITGFQTSNYLPIYLDKATSNVALCMIGIASTTITAVSSHNGTYVEGLALLF